MKPMLPNWKNIESKNICDNKYNFSNCPISFPGYIVSNKEYPFTFCNALTVGETNNWAMGDEEEQFNRNLVNAPADWKYRTKSITYDINSNGYRTYEWQDIDWKNSVVIFGDSCTYGIGLDQDETISYLLQKKINKPVINLGYPSASNHLIINNCAAMIEHFGMPYGVVINWSTTDRFRFYDDSNYHEIGPWNKNTQKHNQIINGVDVEKLWAIIFYNPTNELAINYYLSTYADAMFKGKTKYLKISYFNLSAHYTRSDAFFPIKGTARDMLHPGIENSEEVANFIAERFRD